MNINEGLFNFLYSLANKNILLDIIVVFLAKFLLYGLVLIAASIIFFEKDRVKRYYFAALGLIAVIFSSGIMVPVMNYIIYNPRPFVAIEGLKTLISHPGNSSFPSGHMMFITPIALTVFYINRRMGYWFFGATILMGFARIIAGVHWPFDIVAGILLGALCFYIVKGLLYLGGLKNK